MEKQAQLARRKKRRRALRRVGFFVVLAAAIVGIVVLVSSPGGKKHKAADKATTTTTTTLVADAATCPSAHESRRVLLFKTPPPHCIPLHSVWDATFDTSLGPIVVRMDAAQSYAAVNNFVFLARWNYYNGTFFHRVVTSFVDQGGDPTGTGTGGPQRLPGYSFTGNTPPKACEAKKDCYPAGSLAMANSSGPKTNGSQFFFVVGSGGKDLPPDYTLFGHVTSGLPVVDKINTYGEPASVGDGAGTPKKKIYVLKVAVNQVAG